MEAFSDDHIEALTELLNLGMGQAGAALGQMFDTFVKLNVPKVQFVSPSEVSAKVGETWPAGNIHAARQGFYDALQGEAIVIFDTNIATQLRGLIGVDDDDDISDNELLLEIANIYAGACLSGIAGQMQKEIAFYAPVMAGNDLSIPELFDSKQLEWKHALLTQIVLEVKKYSVANTILIFLPDESFLILKDALDEFIKNY